MRIFKITAMLILMEGSVVFGQDFSSSTLLIVKEDYRGKEATLELLSDLKENKANPLLVFRDYAILVDNFKDSHSSNSISKYIELIADAPLDLQYYRTTNDSLDILTLKYWNRLFTLPQGINDPVDKDTNNYPIANDFIENPYITSYHRYGLDSLPKEIIDYLKINPHNKNKLLLSTVDGASGYIAATVFFPESVNPEENSENWSEVDWFTGYYEIVAALQWWAKKAPLSANLTFNIGYFNPDDCPTDVEPIEHTHDDQNIWIHDVMDALGYARWYYNWWNEVNFFNDQMCYLLGTDAAYSVFLINSENDSDGEFSDNMSAYAYSGGPFAVLTWDNGIWRDIFNTSYGSEYSDWHLRWVGAHESGHIFQAPDEYYYGPGNPNNPEACNGAEDCADPYNNGYPNGNCEACNQNPESSIMRQDFLTRPLSNQNYPYDNRDTKISYWARGIIGWGETGNLIVNTNPVAGGIYVNGEFKWFGGWSGYVPPGSYTVSFGDYINYITPSSQVVSVDAHNETVVTGSYIGNSDISVTTNTSPNPCYTYEPLALTGDAHYNTGQPVNNATATITIRETGAQYTAPVTNGTFDVEFPAPGSPGSYNIDTDVDDGSLSGGFTEPLAVVGGGGGSGYTYGYDVMCRDVQDYDPFFPIYEIYAFEERDEQVLCWVEINNVYEPVQFKFEWYTPSGELFQDAQISEWTDDPQDFGWDYWGWWRIAFGWYTSGAILLHEGLWEIRIFVRTQSSGWTYHSSQHMTLRYDLREHVMCKDVQGSYPYDYLEPTNNFLQTDTYAYTWMRLDTVSVLLDVMWEFYEPNGDLYTAFDTFFVDPESQGYDYDYWHKIWGRIRIDGYSAEHKCGDWSVNVYLKDAWDNYEPVYQDFFRIEENPDVNPYVSASISPPNPKEVDIVYLNIGASDNSYLQTVAVYYSINGMDYERIDNDIFNPTFASTIPLGTFPRGTQIQYYARAWDTSNNTYLSSTEIISIQDEDVLPPTFSNYLPEEVNVGVPFYIQVDIVDPSGIYDDNTGSEGQGVHLIWDNDGELYEDFSGELQLNVVSGNTYQTISEIEGQPAGSQFIFQISAHDNDFDFSDPSDRRQGVSDQQLLEIPQRLWYVSTTGNDETGDGSSENPFASIQHAINSASDEDTVLVYPGAYQDTSGYHVPCIFTNGRILAIISIEGQESTSIIPFYDGPECMTWPMIVIQDSQIYLEGFSIQGADLCDPGSPVININSSNVHINSCSISGGVNFGGGAITAALSKLEVSNCNIESTNQWNYVQGGGIYANNTNSCLLVDNCNFTSIINNWSPNGYTDYIHGGAIYAECDTVEITQCVFTNIIEPYALQFNYSLLGGIIYVSSPNCIIDGNRFNDNDFSIWIHSLENLHDIRGGLVYIEGNGQFSHNTFYGNSLEVAFEPSIPIPDSQKVKGGIIYCDSSSINIKDNIIARMNVNSYSVIADEKVGVFGAGFYGSYDIFDNNLVWGNYPDNIYLTIEDDSLEYLNSDPRFASLEDYNLAANSPCVDAASDGTDIGAIQDNYGPEVYSIVYVDSAYIDSTQNGTNEYPYAAIQAGIDASVDGDTVLVASGTYFGNGNHDIATNGKAIKVKGESAAIIDGQSQAVHGFYLNGSQEDTTTIIEGFTITNLEDGIRLAYASPKLIGIDFISNSAYGVNTQYNPVSPIIESSNFINTQIGVGLGSGLWGSRMADCNFEGNSKGIYFKYDSYDFEAARCNFENNGIGVDAYNISLFSGCRFDSCHFIGNDQAINGGFILTNSYIANGIDGMDGGVMFSGYENHISNCIIENMSGVVFSGAGAAQDVSNCIIRNNTGAVALVGVEERVGFNNCKIYNNNGGISVGGFDTGLYLSNCLYFNNYQPISFQAIQYGTLGISNSTICNNHCMGVQAGAIDGGSISVFRSIIAFNDSCGFKYASGDSIASIQYCDIYENNAGNFCNFPDRIGQNGNISADPLFCFPDSGNFYIYNTSPCAPENNPDSVLIGALGVGCERENRAYHVSIAGSDSTGDGSEEYPYATIDHAIGEAASGDSILIHAGTYVYEYNMENFNPGFEINSKDLVLIGVDGAGAARIQQVIQLDECASPTLININNSNSYIDSLEIVGSFTCDPGGPVVSINSSDITIRNCVISGGKSFFGTGITMSSSRLTLMNSAITNTAHEHSCEGGAILVNSDCSYILVDSTTFSNTAWFWGYTNNRINGGAIHSEADSTIITNCTFDNICNSSSTEKVSGGVLNISSPSINIANNIFKDTYINFPNPPYEPNTINGLVMCLDGAGFVQHNTISNNSLEVEFYYAEGDSVPFENKPKGGGIYSASSNISFIDNIISENSLTALGHVIPADSVVVIQPCGAGFYGAYSNFDNNLVWGNYPDNIYLTIEDDSLEYLNSDPRFASLEDYNLAANSPCVDAASDGTDIGAIQDNYGPEVYMTIWVDSAYADSTQHGTADYPFANIQAGIDGAVSGDTVLAMPGTYAGATITGKQIAICSQYIATGDTTYISATSIDGLVLEHGSNHSPIVGITVGAINIIHGSAILQFCNSGPVSLEYGGEIGIDYCKFENISGMAVFSGGDVPSWATISNTKFISCDTGVYSTPEIESFLVDSCEFIDNDLALFGSVTVTNSTIRDGTNGVDGALYSIGDNNTFTNCQFKNLNGIAVTSAGVSSFTNCIFENNTGAIAFAAGDRHLSFRNCKIRNNMGAGIRAELIAFGTLVLDSCLYVSNAEPIYYSNSGDGQLTISNSTLADNDSSAICAITQSSEIDISNSIMAFNGGFGAYCSTSTGVITVSCCDAYDNAEGNYSGFPDPTGINGNILVDPQFCPDSGNYQIYDTSPCAPENNDCGILIGAGDVGCWSLRLLTGHVYNGNYAPIANVLVEVYESDALTSGKISDTKSGILSGGIEFERGLILDIVDSDYTDSLGLYEFYVAPGIYDLHLSHESFDDIIIAGVVVELGDSTVVPDIIVPSGYPYLPGDANMYIGQWPPQVIGSDVTYLVGYFRGLNEACLLGAPGYYCSADANGDCQIIGSDVTKMVTYFRGLDSLSYCPDYLPSWPTPNDVPEIAPAGWPNCETPPVTGNVIKGSINSK